MVCVNSRAASSVASSMFPTSQASEQRPAPEAAPPPDLKKNHREPAYLLPPDTGRALTLLESAAATNRVSAQLLLATLCEEGYGTVKRDAVRALQWWEKIAAHTDATDQLHIGFWYDTHSDYDDSDSGRWWRGKKLSRKESTQVAAGWYLKAEAQGDFEAARRLSQMYLSVANS
jgi:hypothetical protein